MQSILEAFAQENLHTYPAYFKKGTEYARLMKESADLIDVISDKLSLEDKKFLDQLLDVEDNLGTIHESNYFSYSFQIATLMMIEVFSQTDRLFGPESPDD